MTSRKSAHMKIIKSDLKKKKKKKDVAQVKKCISRERLENFVQAILAEVVLFEEPLHRIVVELLRS